MAIRSFTFHFQLISLPAIYPSAFGTSPVQGRHETAAHPNGSPGQGSCRACEAEGWTADTSLFAGNSGSTDCHNQSADWSRNDRRSARVRPVRGGRAMRAPTPVFRSTSCEGRNA